MRLAGQEKMGFYPTPRCVVDEIKGVLDIDEEARLFDPCCGEGASLWTLVADEELEQAYSEARAIFRKKLAQYPKMYGIELDKERAEVAKRKLHYFLNCDALTETRVSKEAFGLLWLNPPYDQEQGDVTDTRQRLELKFLRRFLPSLQMGGVLVYLIPWTVISKVGRYLANRVGDLKVYAFPPDEYSSFHQVLVMGIKRPLSKEDVEKNKRLFASIRDIEVEQVPEKIPVVGGQEFRKYTYEVPGSLMPEDALIFKSFRIDPNEAYDTIRKDGLYDLFLSETMPREINRIRPLTALRQGHLAMLLASGLMNGEVEKDGKKYLIKGSVRKVVKRSETDEEIDEEGRGRSKITETDQFQITVKMLDYESGTIKEIR